MTTQEVADRLVSLCREGKNMEAITELYADDVVSIEPNGAPQKEVKGKEGVLAKDKMFFEMVEEVHSANTSDPVVGDNYFAVSMGMDLTMKGGMRMQMDEVALYHVKDGKIAKEEFFFTPMQQPA